MLEADKSGRKSTVHDGPIIDPAEEVWGDSSEEDVNKDEKATNEALKIQNKPSRISDLQEPEVNL